MKQAFRLSCLALLMSSSLLLAYTPLPPEIEGSYLTMFPTKWHMVDALVNKQIKAKVGWGLESWKRRLTHLGLLALPVCAAAGVKKWKISGKLKNTLNNVNFLVPATLLLPVAYNFYHRSNLIEHEEQERIELLMSRWPELRPYFPEELYQQFDAVYQLREEASADYTVNATKMLHNAQDLASKHMNEHENRGAIPSYINPFSRGLTRLLTLWPFSR